MPSNSLSPVTIECYSLSLNGLSMIKLKPRRLRIALLLFSLLLPIENLPIYAYGFVSEESASCQSDSWEAQKETEKKSDILIAALNPSDLIKANETRDTSKPIGDLNVSGKVNSDFSTEYSAITKRILLTSIELERFSLHYRAECLKPSVFRQVRYVCSQEAGAAGALTFEIMAIRQFNIGRNHPLKLSTSALRGAFTTSLITSTIAGSGSALELLNDCFDAIKHKSNGYDPPTAKRYVLTKLDQIDKLLAERENIVAAYKDQAGYRRAVLRARF